MGDKTTKKLGTSGFTLVELMVAISLGFFVIMLVFSGYTDVFRALRSQAKKADNIQNMVLVRASMSRALRDISTVNMASANRISFTKKGKGEGHSVELRDSTLWSDNVQIGKKIKNCVFSLSEKYSPDGYRLLTWEVVLAHGGWVGGAMDVR
jgi:Tfp pilus assembly protein PilW